MQYLKNAGLQSLPGGGAEIFDPEIRKQICEDELRMVMVGMGVN